MANTKQVKAAPPPQATKQTALHQPAAPEQAAASLVHRAAAAPSSLSPTAVQRLGRAYGNRAVSRLLDVSPSPAVTPARGQAKAGQHAIQRQVMGVDTWKKQAGLGWFYYAGLLVAAGIAIYHYTLIRERQREQCFKAFLHNNWFGMAIFAGIFVDYWVQ